MSERLERLRRKRDFYEHGPAYVTSLWPTYASFDWFTREHREPLVEAGAMRKLGRDWFIDTELMSGAAEHILLGQSAVEVSHA